VTRFNESIDQSLTHAVHSYVEKVEQDRNELLANEQASREEAEAANRAKDVFLALSHRRAHQLTRSRVADSCLQGRWLLSQECARTPSGDQHSAPSANQVQKEKRPGKPPPSASRLFHRSL
jgi:hypothetical protein